MDALAQRYHKTPSEVWRDCDALDYVVMTTAQGWERAQQQKANKNPGEVPDSARHIPPESLRAMIDRVKNSNENS